MAIHSSLTDPNIHEPKDISTANSGEVYIADGAGSGAWTTRLPSMSSKSGFLLTNNGTAESWSSDSSVRARCSIANGSTTPTLGTGSVNISGVTRTTAGFYTVAFTTNLASANFQVFAMGLNNTSGYPLTVVAYGKSVSGFALKSYLAGTGFLDFTDCDIIVYGGF